MDKRGLCETVSSITADASTRHRMVLMIVVIVSLTPCPLITVRR